MPGDGTQASPAMVNRVSELEEVELNTKDGTVKPLANVNADPSVPASPEGAPPDPAVAPTEAQPSQPAPTPVAPEQPAPMLDAQPPVVEVVPRAPAPAASAPAEPAPVAAPVTEEKSPTEAEQLESLKTFGDTVAEGARRAAQSTADRHATQLDRQLQDANARQTELTNQVRDLQTKGMTEEERAAVLATFEQDDRSADLDAKEKQLLDLHRTTYMDSLMLEFGNHGVTREALEQIESPEAMEIFCERQKSGTLEAQLKNGVAPAAPAAEAPVEKPPEAKTEPKEEPPAEPQVPAGAMAPSDVGTGSTPPGSKSFDSSQDAGALRANLRGMDWDTVHIR